MSKILSKTYKRLQTAWWCIKNPDLLDEEYNSGIELGKAIAFAQVRQQFDTHDPYQFSNQHFQLGYYYAAEQAKKVMPNDEDNLVA